MKKLSVVLSILFLISLLSGQYRFKCIVNLPYGLFYGDNILCSNTNHNNLNELIFEQHVQQYISAWQVWEHHPMNQYQLVYADTGAFPPLPGITTGNFPPNDVGDIDRDSLSDLVGPNRERANDSTFNVVTTQESPNYSSYPENLSWWYRFAYNEVVSQPFYFPPDLDSDNKNEIMFVAPAPLGVVIFENVANNQNVVAWHTTQGIIALAFAFGDFDLDGHKEFVTADGSSLGRVYIYENIGDNQYGVVQVDTVRIPNSHDVFSGNDVDGDGHPEFFIRFAQRSGGSWIFYLYMWEATGNNTYQRTLIDQVTRSRFDPGDMKSLCGDVDGDGIDEIVWSIASDIFVYKATGNNQFQVVWHWINPDPGPPPGVQEAKVNIYDMNQNGYGEIVISGTGTTRLFELEAVRLLSPNGEEVFQADSSELIQWQKFYPPRCDSLSLYYSTDNGRTYLPLASGISASDTSYLWTVPNVNSDSCKVKIIAYGPGWQYDESDGIFRITSTGIEERSPLSALRFPLKVFPNPTKSQTAIHYSLPNESKVSLQLYDISGRLIKTLVDENKNPGIYKIFLNSKTLSAGVYFLSLQTEINRLIERLVIIK